MGLEIAAATAGKAIAAVLLAWWQEKRGGTLPKWFAPLMLVVALVFIYLGYCAVTFTGPFSKTGT